MKMLSQLLSLVALLVSSTFAAYPPAYLSATGAYPGSCSECGMSPSSLDAAFACRKTNTVTSVAAFHTGAGTNAVILTNDTDKALTGQFDKTYWTFNGFSTTYSLYMQPTAKSKFASKCDSASSQNKSLTPRRRLWQRRHQCRLCHGRLRGSRRGWSACVERHGHGKRWILLCVVSLRHPWLRVSGCASSGVLAVE